MNPYPPPARTGSSKWRDATLAAAFFLLLTAWYAWPIFRHPGSVVADLGDPLQHLSISWWTARRILAGHLAGIWSVPPMYWPERTPLAYGDPQFGVTLLGLHVYAASHNVLLAYNFVVIVALAGSAFTACLLARTLTGSRAAGLFAGAAWGYCAWHSGEGAHQQILSTELFPLVLLCVHQYARTQERRWLVGLFAAWLGQEFLAEYWAAFLLLLFIPVTLTILGLSKAPRRILVSVLTAIGCAVAPWLALQAPLLRLHRMHRVTEIDSYSADLADYLPVADTVLWGPYGRAHLASIRDKQLPSPEMMLSPGALVLLLAAGSLPVLFVRRPARPRLLAPATALRVENFGAFLLVITMFPAAGLGIMGVPDLEVFSIPRWLVNTGMVHQALAIGLCCVFQARVRTAACWIGLHVRRPASPIWSYFLLAVAGMVWSCGYTVQLFGYPISGGLHTWITAICPPARSLRVLARMGILADLGLVIMAAFSLARLLSRLFPLENKMPWRAGAALVACAISIVEGAPRGGNLFQNAAQRLPQVGEVDIALRDLPPGPAIILPLTMDAYVEGERLWRQTAFEKPMVNGAETFFPTWYGHVSTMWMHPASPECAQWAREAGIRYAVIDLDQSRFRAIDPLVPRIAPGLPSPWKLRFSSRQAVIYSLESTPVQEPPDRVRKVPPDKPPMR